MLINQASGYIEEKNGNKYLIFYDIVNKNKELQKNDFGDFWDENKNEIKAINGGKGNNYRKDYIKIKLWQWLAIKQTTKISCYDHNYHICFWKRW